jgi:hypothetical protein
MRSVLPVLIVLSCLAGCRKQPELRFLQDSLTLESGAGSATVEFVSNQPWTVSADCSWCRILPMAGPGDRKASSTLTLIYEENPGHEERTLQITLTAGEMQQHLIVTQQNGEGVWPESTEYTLSDQAQTFELRFWKTFPVEVELDPASQGWLSLAGTKAADEQTVVLTATRNISAAREAKLYLRYGRQTETITIRQKPSDIPISDPQTKSRCVIMYDFNSDGCLSVDEASVVKKLTLTPLDHFSPEEFLFFPAVEEVQIEGYNYPLDLSNLTKLTNLTCAELTSELYLKENTCLKNLSITSGVLNSMDLSELPALTEVWFTYCYSSSPTTVNLSGCPKLKKVYAVHCGSLQALGLRDCPNLEWLIIQDCGSMARIDSVEFLSLQLLHIEKCPLMESIISPRYPSLVELYISLAKVPELHLEDASNLSRIVLQDTPLVQMELPDRSALKTIEIRGTQLSALNIGNQPYLFSLAVSSCEMLESLSCHETQLESLDLTGNPNLHTVNVFNNPELKTVYLIAGKQYDIYYNPDITALIYR